MSVMSCQMRNTGVHIVEHWHRVFEASGFDSGMSNLTAQRRDLLVITDMEPDDRIALLLLAAEFPTEILYAGTTGLHAGRKQALAARFLDRIGLAGTAVIQGTGGESASYPEIASTRAAREYQSEESGLLPEADLVAIGRDMPGSSERLSRAIRDSLRRHDDIEIVLRAVSFGRRISNRR